MAEFADSAVGSEGQDTAPDFQVEATDSGFVSLPDGFDLSTANFETDGMNLVLTSADGAQVSVEGFFAQENPPELVSSDGAQISGDMAAELAGGPGSGDESVSAGTDGDASAATGGMIADNPTLITGTDGEPIGNVENLEGTVFAIHTDGTRVELKEGDPVFQGDIIESTGDGSVGILLADETTFSMGENGRIVLDEMVYDPATQEGSVGLSVMEGVFTFVSGQVAKTDPDAMTLDTPVATIGIRGTQVGLKIGGDPEGTLTDNGDGTWTFEPGPKFDGTVKLNYDVNDGEGDSNMSSTFSLTGEAGGDGIALNATQNPDGTYTIASDEILSAMNDDSDFMASLENIDTFSMTASSINDMVLSAGGEPKMSIVLMEEADGFVGEIVIANAGGVQVMNTANQFTTVASFDAAPAETQIMEVKDLIAAFGSALRQLPTVHGNQNTFGLEEGGEAGEGMGEEGEGEEGEEEEALDEEVEELEEGEPTAEELEELETAAGEEEIEEEGEGEDGKIETTDEEELDETDLDLDLDLAPELELDTGPEIDTGPSPADLAAARAAAEASARAAAEAALRAAQAEAGQDAAAAANRAQEFADRARALADDAADNVGRGDSLVPNVPNSLLGSVGDGLQGAVAEMRAVFAELRKLSAESNTAANLSQDAADDAKLAAAGATGGEAFTGKLDAENAEREAKTQLDTAEDRSDNVADEWLALQSAVATVQEEAQVQIEAFAAEAVIAAEASREASTDANEIVVQADQQLSDTLNTGRFAIGTEWETTEANLTQSVADLKALAADVDQAATDAETAAAAAEAAAAAAGIGTAEFADIQAAMTALIDAEVAVLDFVKATQVGETLDEDALAALQAAVQDAKATLAAETVEAMAVTDATFIELQKALDDLQIAQAELQTATDTLADATTAFNTLLADVDSALQIIADSDWVGTDGDDVMEVGDLNVTGQTMDGGLGDDLIDAGAGDDVLLGGEGNDVLIGGEGADVLDGGAGIDTADYSGDVLGVVVNLETGEGFGGDAQGDTLIDIENVIGGSGDDTLIGDGGDNVLVGGAGDDVIIGGGGTDTAVIGGTFGDFTITRAEDGTITVTAPDVDAVVGDVDTISGVEIIQFGDETVHVLDAAVNEDTAMALDITGALGDLTEAASIVISGAPPGSTLTLGDGGTVVAADDGSFTLRPDQVAGVTITPPKDSDVDFSVTISELDATGAQTGLGFIDIAVQGIADAASLNVDANADGDPSAQAGATSIALDITAGLTDTDGSETLSITISGLPDGAILSAGDGPDPVTGEWTLTADQLEGLTMTSADGFSTGGFTLTVTATTTEREGGEPAVVSGTIAVTVQGDGAADAPTLDLNSALGGDQLTSTAAGGEDTDIVLDINAELTDDTESLSVTISDVPDGAKLFIVNPGEEPVEIQPDANGDYQIPPGLFELDGEILLRPAPDSDEDFDLTVTATSTTLDGQTATTTGTISVDVAAIADEPVFKVLGETRGDEDTAIPLNITAERTDKDGSETLSVTISGFPAGAFLLLADGITKILPDANGEVTLAESQVAGITVTPPPDSGDDFTLTVTATTKEAENDSTFTTEIQTIDVVVDAVADAPTLDVTVSQGVPGGISSEPAAADPTPDDSSTHQVIGTDGDDIIEGAKREEFIDGGAGNDIITGSGGADVIVGGEGNDYVEGGEGHDVIFGGEGDDVLKGGKGSDEIYGGAGNDVIEGGEGADILSGGAGDDFIDGGRFHEGGEGGGHYHDGSQSDTVLFTGPRDNYMITENADGSFTVHDMFAGRDGTDTVINVENFQFADGTIDETNLLATNPTTFILDIDAALTDTDLSESLSITVSGLPEGAFLTFGTQNADGSWTLTPEEAAEPGLGIIVPYDVVVDFNLSVEARSDEFENDSFATTTETINVDIDATPPDLTVSDATGGEDTDIPLDISAALVDADGSESLSVTIGGVPEDATLKVNGVALTANADGTYTLASDQLTDLTVTPPADSNVDFDLTVTATADEVLDGTASTTGTIHVDVTGVADGATLDVADASGNEDSAISLNISAGLADTDGSETLSVTIAGMPTGAVLSAGTQNADGTWTLSADDLGGLHVTPPADFSGDFTLTVTATGTEDDGDFASRTGTILVSVDPDADAPTLDLSSTTSGDQHSATVSGVEDGDPIALDISSALTDTDGSETLSVTITGVPAGATLSAGTEGPAGTWTLTPAQLTGLTVTPAAGSDADFTLTVTATSTDGTDEATTTGTIDITVDAAVVEDTTTEGANLTVDGTADGDEDTAIALDISATLIDTDGSETLSVTIAGVPEGAILSAGTFVTNEDGSTTWTVEADDVGGLTITPEQDSNVDFDLTVTATSIETDGGATSTTEPATVHVDITGVADAPTVSASVGNVLSESYHDTIMANEPVAYWQFDEGSDGAVVDSAGNHTGEYHRGAESEGNKHGMGDGAGDFDGKNDHVTIDHSEDLELSGGSITVWFNSDHVNDKQGLFSKDSSGFDDGGHMTAFVDDGTVKIRLQSGEDSFWVDGGSLSDNTWHQVTFNWGENGMELYVDGQLVDSNPYTGGIENNTEPLVIGANSWSSGDGEADHLKDYFDGQIDEFSILGEPLTADQISDLYNTGGQTILNNGGTIGADVVASGSYELQIAGALADTDSSETLSVIVGGVPSGASLSAGIDNGDGTWTLLDSELSGLVLTTDETVTEDFDLTVTAVATEDDGDTATTLTTVHVEVDGIADPSVSLTGSSGDDVLVGGSGDDILKGRGGDDELYGGDGDDVMFGSSGADTLDGGDGDDVLFGSSGKDVLDGGAGNDYLDGGSGNDVIDGGAGDDNIKGGRGDDVIRGGAGDDRMEGGEGADTFIFDAESGNDIVTDIMGEDVLVFEGQEFHMDDMIFTANEDGDAVVTFGGVEGTSVTLTGVSADSLNTETGDGYTISEDDGAVSIVIDGA